MRLSERLQRSGESATFAVQAAAAEMRKG